MDWLDEKFYKIKERVVNFTLRKALCFYIVVFCLIVIICTFFTLSLCQRWSSLIWQKYAKEIMFESSRDYSMLSNNELFLIKGIDFVYLWCVVFYSICGIIGASYLFYRNKLREPLLILEEGSKKISKNELDFEMIYNRKDELGNLCNSFETMRKQLIYNKQSMWDLTDQQRQLNAAFAHDLRTPLTVLRGYTDFLIKYVPQQKISEEKLISTLKLMWNHIDRLGDYSNTMKDINSLEDFPLHPSPMNILILQSKMEEIIHIFDGTDGITITLLNESSVTTTTVIDEKVVIEVFENILSNAMRYALSKIEVVLDSTSEPNTLLLSILDDGKGFTSRDLSMAVTPYYKNNPQEKSEHFGIGLYICKVLCEKHGGNLSLSNSVKKGAIVTASFAYQ